MILCAHTLTAYNYTCKYTHTHTRTLFRHSCIKIAFAWKCIRTLPLKPWASLDVCFIFFLFLDSTHDCACQMNHNNLRACRVIMHKLLLLHKEEGSSRECATRSYPRLRITQIRTGRQTNTRLASHFMIVLFLSLFRYYGKRFRNEPSCLLFDIYEIYRA